jgi:2-iminobutanoate/2-iminopropanoate deaminase
MMLFNSPALPTPAGHYSQAVIHQGMVFISGQLPRVPGRPEFIAPDIAAQTLQCLENAEAILLAAGSRRDLVIKSTLYVTGIGHWGVVNEVYAKFFGAHKPARAIIPVGEFKDGCLIEIDMVAVLAAD